MITKEGFNEVINTIAEIYPKDVPSIQGQKIYFMIFSKNFESDDEFMNATLKVLETRVFTSFPKPAEFLEACKRKDDIESEVILAISDVKNAIKKYGAYNNVCFENPVIHKVIQNLFGSWVKMCKMELEEFDNLIKWDFPKIYKHYREQKIKEVPLFLEGIATHNNSLGNQKEELKICYVGNEEKCKKWNLAYYNKNQLDLVNKEKVKQLGFVKEEPKQIEHIAEFKSADEIIEVLEVKRIEKPKKTGIEYTQEQLKQMIING
jgi:hypothetical protein